MCGIAGVFLYGEDPSHISQAVECMCQQMFARGPDDSGFWSDLDNGVGLGHRRLSIIDLDTSASQPMHS